MTVETLGVNGVNDLPDNIFQWLIESQGKKLCENKDCIVRGPHWHPDEQA